MDYIGNPNQHVIIETLKRFLVIICPLGILTRILLEIVMRFTLGILTRIPFRIERSTGNPKEPSIGNPNAYYIENPDEVSVRNPDEIFLRIHSKVLK